MVVKALRTVKDGEIPNCNRLGVDECFVEVSFLPFN